MSETPNPNPQPIEYAPPLKPLRRRLRRAAGPLLLLAMVLSAPWWGKALWLRAQLIYWQNRCMTYTAPPETITTRISWFDEVPSLRPIESAIPHAWARFYQLVSPPGFQSGGTLFLHEMRRPSGTRLLVAVDYTTPNNFQWGYFHIRAFEPGQGWKLPRQVEDIQWRVPLQLGRGAAFHAGQIDPGDPTHFTARFTSMDVEYQLDGWIRKDTIDLEVKPATQPTTSRV